MKFTRILLICALTVSLLAVTACTNTPTETTEQNGGVTDPVTEEITEAPVVQVDVTLTVKDQDGNAMSKAEMTILPSNDQIESVTVTADENGTATVTLAEGKYTVRFDILPEYVLGIDTPITVSAGMEPLALEVTNNTPNGTPERPFVINEDAVATTIPAGVTYTYTLFGANNRIVTVKNPNLEIIFKDTTYTPDENGDISFRVTSDSPREHVFFSITNKGSETCETTVTLASDPGTMDNPFVIETLGENISVNVPKDGLIYYTWTATTKGTLTVNSADAINNISLNNLTTSQVTDFTQGSESASISINEGDVITVVVSTVGGDQNAEFQTVTFMLTLT